MYTGEKCHPSLETRVSYFVQNANVENRLHEYNKE